jgi:DNA (cytosine-5)-methyltransferase 1
MGYDARWCVLGASDVGAPHERKRIWIAAHSNGGMCDGWADLQRRETQRGTSSDGSAEKLTNAERNGWGTGRTGRLDSSAARESEQPLDHIECERFQASGPERNRDDEALRVRDECSGYVQAPSLTGGSESDYADTMQPGLQGREAPEDQRGTMFERGHICEWWATEPGLVRMVHGVAHRVDRIRAIGNGQVPAVARLAWETLTRARLA